MVVGVEREGSKQVFITNRGNNFLVVYLALKEFISQFVKYKCKAILQVLFIGTHRLHFGNQL